MHIEVGTEEVEKSLQMEIRELQNTLVHYQNILNKYDYQFQPENEAEVKILQFNPNYLKLEIIKKQVHKKEKQYEYLQQTRYQVQLKNKTMKEKGQKYIYQGIYKKIKNIVSEIEELLQNQNQSSSIFGSAFSRKQVQSKMSLQQKSLSLEISKLQQQLSQVKSQFSLTNSSYKDDIGMMMMNSSYIQ